MPLTRRPLCVRLAPLLLLIVQWLHKRNKKPLLVVLEKIEDGETRLASCVLYWCSTVVFISCPVLHLCSPPP